MSSKALIKNLMAALTLEQGSKRRSSRKKTSSKLYRGRKGSSVGYLKSAKPHLRDADNDNVVGERAPKAGKRYPRAPKP